MDIKRTALWVVFTVSLLFLWDNWMRHTGQWWPLRGGLSLAESLRTIEEDNILYPL